MVQRLLLKQYRSMDTLSGDRGKRDGTFQNGSEKCERKIRNSWIKFLKTVTECIFIIMANIFNTIQGF